MKVEVHFLGQPEILIDHVRLTITQKKIEAMLLYILFNGTCTRDELVAIFWCDCDEEGARGNLRNSLYKIRNLIGKDFLLTGGRSYISLNLQGYGFIYYGKQRTEAAGIKPILLS